MTNSDNRRKNAADLRQKAETFARQRVVRTPNDSAALSPDDIQDTLHELRVHQIELEMQNEELRTAQAEIEAGRARYFDLYDLAPVGYCTLSEKGVIVEANLTAATLLGTNRSALIKQPISRFILKEDQDIYYLHRKQLFEVGGPQECELRLVKPDGTHFWAHLTVIAAQAEDGATVCRVVLSDITERRRAEEELRHLRNYLSNIIDSMPSVLVGVDAEAKITLWNKTAEKNTGVVGAHAQGYLLSHIFPRLAPEMKKITESIRSREIIHHRKRTCVSERGPRYEDVTIYPLTGERVEGAVIRIDDVTEQVRLEEMMVQAEKMLSIGGFAAGMAHEINNPLAGIMQTANVMADRLTNENMPANLKAAREAGVSMAAIRNFMEARGIPRMLKTIRKSGLRAAEIVSNMLGFARKSEAQVSFHDLSDLIDKTLDLAATDYDIIKQYDFKSIEIRREFEDGLPPVSCEGAKIQQVLLNIFRNGAEAMQTAGTGKPIFIVRTEFDKERKMVCMEIEDNGPGMDEAICKRVFEPFYTTKPVGEGTGLGLSVSYFIITENYGGKIAVESQPGKGTKFVIRLPLKSTNEELSTVNADLLPKNEAAALTDIKQQVLKSGKGARKAVQTTIAGRPLVYDLTVEPLQNSAGVIVGITGASQDVTETKGRERTDAAANGTLPSKNRGDNP
ncbi:PAS domain S-box protein [uncultured Desulfobacter sp.]|uniref:PAS domain S-box protein n=1 Tax=uncultured Desulfobacter sp. TaxID=240139 RepID=UPI0029C60597|nr:PAS domain S-box protein [uncultured Desulfobacter sp.]